MPIQFVAALLEEALFFCTDAFALVMFCDACYTLRNYIRNEVLAMRLHHNFIWSTLLHFMTNWSYGEVNFGGGDPEKVWLSPASPKMRFDYDLYRQHLQDLKAAGVNAIIVDPPPKKSGVCLLYCFMLSPVISLGAVPHHHLALSVKELTYSSNS